MLESNELLEVEETYTTEPIYYIDSREVAEIIEKEHKNLLQDIRKYLVDFAELNFQPGDFFIESTYMDANNQSRPCYKVTKKGCEFIAHKLIGIKGTKFTATYINRFHDMEEHINENLIPMQELAKQVEELKTMVLDIRETQATERNYQSNVVLPMKSTPDGKNWYERNKEVIKEACVKYGVNHRRIYHNILSQCSEKYDMEKANEIYRRKVGHYPMYQMDLVDFFPQLSKIADEYITEIV